MLVGARLRAVCLGSVIFSVVCMFLAGLYVGLGAFGNACMILVSRGSLGGAGGGGKGLGPAGRPEAADAVDLYMESDESRPGYSWFPNCETGELWIDEWFDDRESGLPASVVPFILSLANRSCSVSAGADVVGAAVDMGLPCILSGFGDGVGLILCGGLIPLITFPFTGGIESGLLRVGVFEPDGKTPLRLLLSRIISLMFVYCSLSALIRFCSNRYFCIPPPC